APFTLMEVGTITIDTPSFAFERGSTKALTTTVRDPKGVVVNVPVVWRSTSDSIAHFLPGGKLVGRDTGLVNVTASALGITSAPIAARVVWVGAASVDTLNWTPPAAATPSTAVADSLHVIVKNRIGGPVNKAHVRFVVTAGGGTVSTDTISTDATG